MIRLSKVDCLIIGDHTYLDSTDECLFLREYIPRVGFSGGETNSLISNFKKGIEKRGRPEWRYKGEAVQRIATELATALNREWIAVATLVPIPPSKARENALYDDRMTQVLRLIPGRHNLNGDIRELIVQTIDMEAAHTLDERPSSIEIENNYAIDESLVSPPPQVIGLFDDLLTTGAHFRAARNVLKRRFPDTKIIGVFVARRIIQETWDDQG